MENKNLTNPWKGLNFYTEGEVLYGRNAEIQSLSQYIFNNTQTVLYGRSGIGKSSILNAGIFPKARLAGMVPIGIRLKHGDTYNYLEQIRNAITAGGLKMQEILPAINGTENETLWEFMHRHTFCNEEGEQRVPLLVFDQFEEIFTLQKNEKIKREFFRQLGNLLNEVKPAYIVEYENKNRQQQGNQQETKVVSSGAFKGLSLKLNIRRNDTDGQSVARYLERPNYHIVFAMREDFLSSLELYASSIPVMKDNRFGLLPINEEQAADIIRLPRKGLVNDEVTKLIIQQVTGRMDFELDGKPEIEVDAAVLSLFLSRLYIKKPENEEQITAELVNNYSGHIIYDFYVDSITSNEAENEILSKDTVLLLENQLLTREGRRNNVSRSDLIAQGVTDAELNILIDKRKLLRQFHHGNDIRIEYIHDILCPVVKERKEQREMLLQQELERKRQEEEKLRLQAEAEKKQREIEEKAAREKAELEAAALKTKIRNRRIYTISAAVLLAVLLGVTYYYFANIYVYKSYYADFTRQNGWPVGVGEELTEEEMEQSPLYYCLSHVGSSAPIMKFFGVGVDDDLITDVEVLSSNARLPHRPRISSFEIADIETRDNKALAYNDLLSNIRKIHFVGGEDNLIEKEVALGENDSTLFLITYFHINNSEMWGSILSPNGQPMQIREKEGIDRMKISMDSLGRIRSLMYYDENGVRMPIADGICGFAWKYDNDTEKRYILNQFSLPIDKPYNLVITRNSNNTVTTLYRRVVTVEDTIETEARGPEGYSKLVACGSEVKMFMSDTDENFATKTVKKDSKGNILSEQIENNISSIVPTVINYTYSPDGELIKKEKLNSSGEPFAVREKENYLYEWGYENGKKVKEIRYNKAGISYQHVIEKYENVTTEIREDRFEGTFIAKVDSLFSDGSSTSYYGSSSVPVNCKVKMEEDSIVFHRQRCYIDGNTERRFFYIYNGQEVKSPLIKDEYGKAWSYFCKEIKKDDSGNIVSYKKYDENMKIVKSMMFITLNGEIIGRAVEGVDGTPVRCDKWEEEGFLYYKIYYNKDFDDNFVGIQGVNEWNQESVFNDPFAGYLLVLYKDFGGYSINNNGNEVPIVRSYKQFVLDPAENISDFSYPYLHILDKESVLYKSGFKDGDRIVKFGNWTVGGSETSLSNAWNSWCGSNKDVAIEVLRPNPTGSADRITANVKCDKNSADLQEYHILHITKEEYDYLNKRSILK